MRSSALFEHAPAAVEAALVPPHLSLAERAAVLEGGEGGVLEGEEVAAAPAEGAVWYIVWIINWVGYFVAVFCALVRSSLTYMAMSRAQQRWAAQPGLALTLVLTRRRHRSHQATAASIPSSSSVSPSYSGGGGGGSISGIAAASS